MGFGGGGDWNSWEERDLMTPVTRVVPLASSQRGHGLCFMLGQRPEVWKNQLQKKGAYGGRINQSVPRNPAAGAASAAALNQATQVGRSWPSHALGSGEILQE